VIAKKPQREITHPAAIKTFMPECGVKIRLRCKSCETLGGIDSYTTSRDKFSLDCYMRHTSDTLAAHAAVKGIVQVGIRYNTILQRTLH
jgi:hypothetical protein